MKTIYIFGISGFAREVADVANNCGYSNVTYIAENTNDVDVKLDVELDENCQVICESEVSGIDSSAHFAIGIGLGHVRKKIVDKFPSLNYVNLIHSSACFGFQQEEIIRQARGVVITAGVVFTNNIRVGDFSIFNLNATVGHDCNIGKFVSVMPSVNISGNVALGDFSYIGVGATVLQGTESEKLLVGEGATVGAMALVTKAVAKGSVVVGIPAREK